MKSNATLKPKKLYRWLTLRGNLEASIRALSNAQLRILNGYLARLGETNGIPALIHGLILHEAATRLMIQKDATDHP